MTSNLNARPMPKVSTPNIQLPPRPSQVDMRVRRAQERFQAGQALYERGDIVGAREDFDKALEILLTTPENLPDRFKVERKAEELVAVIHRYDVNGMGAGDFSGRQGYDRAPLEDILEMTFPVDPKLKPKVNEQLQATVSQLPLQLNDAVLSYINYFSGDRGRKTLITGLRRAGRYKPLISKILAEEGVPQELIYLAQAESGFLPRAVSHKAAVGMWQFVRWRGQQYGLNQSTHTDDRLDPERATRSAARHLKDLYEKFGDWYLAIAGYNCGDGCVERAVERTGYADFWDLRTRGALPRETTNYVPIILAMTIMHKNAKDYGLEDVEPDPPLEWDTLELEAPTHLALVADIAGRPVSELRELNPALLSTVAPSGYALHVPRSTKESVAARLESIPSNRRASWRVHRMAEGDTLESVAKQYRMPVNAITAANHTAEASVGDVLIIPTATQVEKLVPKPVKARSGAKASPNKRGVTVKRASSKRESAKSERRRPSAAAVQTASLH
jgi:membrane-bound lytic murein transglycosylase D